MYSPLKWLYAWRLNHFFFSPDMSLLFSLVFKLVQTIFDIVSVVRLIFLRIHRIACENRVRFFMIIVGQMIPASKQIQCSNETSQTTRDFFFCCCSNRKCETTNIKKNQRKTRKKHQSTCQMAVTCDRRSNICFERLESRKLN